MKYVIALFEIAFALATASGCAALQARQPDDMLGAVAVQAAVALEEVQMPAPVQFEAQPTDACKCSPQCGCDPCACEDVAKVTTVSLPRRVVCGPNGCQVVDAFPGATTCESGSCGSAMTAGSCATGTRAAGPIRSRRPVRRLFGRVFCRGCR